MAKQRNSTLLNNIDLEAVAETKKAFEKEDGHHHVEKNIGGVYRLEGSPSFVAELRTDASNVIVSSDEPKALGGRGVHVSPLTYVLFGVTACFANSLAIQCSLNGVELRSLKLKSHLSYDIGPVLSGIDSPLIEELAIEVESDKDITELIELTKERCPALYAINHAIKTDVFQSGRRSARAKARR